jgi:hypothetical protein
MDNAQLKTAYSALLAGVDPAYLDIPARRPGGRHLSGLFLPGVADNYRHAGFKVMVIGSETVWWEPLASKVDHKTVYDSFSTVDTYVERALHLHRRHFERALHQRRRDRGHTFFNYLRDIAKITGKDGLVYANLFCFNWRGSSPVGCPHIDFIKALSRQLLDLQIAILQPDTIVFANGISSAGVRREFFPFGEGGRCSKPVGHPDAASRHYLCTFTLDDRIRCLRTHHPSARSKLAQAGRSSALALLTQMTAASEPVCLA